MFILLVIVILLPTVASNDKQYNALHFGTSSNDNIFFNYDMAPFRDSLSICTWIKRVVTSTSNPVVFNHYSSGNEILIGSNGIYNQVIRDGGLNSLNSKFTTPVGRWFSYCITWSLATRTINLYLNGDLVGTDQTSAGRTLGMGGTLGFNRLTHSAASYYIFGGEIYQFNIYSDVLSSTAVKKIADGGLCFDLDELSATRVLRWEDILERSRSGSVRDVEVCEWRLELDRKLADATGQLNETVVQLSRMEAKLETVTGLLNSTEEELGTVREELNSTKEELGTVRGELGRTENQLQTETGQHNKTVERLETCSASLTDSQTQIESARTFQNITRWDVLYTPPYFNKVFTDQLFQQLTTSWDMLRKFVGANMTKGVVEHFRQYHEEPVCDAFQRLSSTMLRQFMGVSRSAEITEGIIDHFRDTHEDSACDNNTDS